MKGLMAIAGSLAALWGLCVLACVPEERAIALDDFEAECDGSPCGWIETRGTVRWVETLHPGAHGMAISSGGRAEASPPLSAMDPDFITGLLVVGACFDGSRLVVEGEVRDWGASAAGPGYIELTLNDPETAGDYELERPSAFASGGSWAGTVTALEVTAGGGCIIDEIGYTSSQ